MLSTIKTLSNKLFNGTQKLIQTVEHAHYLFIKCSGRQYVNNS